MNPHLQYPLKPDEIMRKKKRIRRELLAENGERTPCRIAILGGSTTAPIREIVELFLLDKGIAPIFYESEYNKWYEDACFGNPELDAFRPQIVYIHTSCVNLPLAQIPAGADEATVETLAKAEFTRYQQAWNQLREKFGSAIIQNNFELPANRVLGNLSAVIPSGRIHFVQLMNQWFAKAADSSLILQDLEFLAADLGLSHWYDPDGYALYKVALSSESIPGLARNLASIIGAILGKSKKCLVLDLDDTIWGGVVSEDGVEGLELGHETPLGESYLAWQRYILDLRDRGVILAVCSKNDEDIAKSGFTHPDCLLKPDDFISFQANWEPKPENIRQIATEINIGLDSLVFLDDNPAERAIVRSQLPMVAVPEVNEREPFSYIRAIEEGRYFEVVTLSQDDLQRNASYAQNKQRKELETASGSYEDFLRSLAMEAEIAPFCETYLSRIAQLTNKSNQFNLTTHRYTETELWSIMQSNRYITLYGRLKDCFGDNGVVSVIIGELKDAAVHIRLWLMSCRVLKRNMEQAMLDALVKASQAAGASQLIGYYYPTKKNHMVSHLYESFGFTCVQDNSAGGIWKLPLTDYKNQNQFIRIQEH